MRGCLIAVKVFFLVLFVGSAYALVAYDQCWWPFECGDGKLPTEEKIITSPPGATPIPELREVEPTPTPAEEAPATSRCSVFETSNSEWRKAHGWDRISLAHSAVAESTHLQVWGPFGVETPAPYVQLAEGDWIVIWIQSEGRLRPFGMINNSGREQVFSLGNLITRLNSSQTIQISELIGIAIMPVDDCSGQPTNIEDVWWEMVGNEPQWGWGYADIVGRTNPGDGSDIADWPLTFDMGKFSPWE